MEEYWAADFEEFVKIIKSYIYLYLLVYYYANWSMLLFSC